MTGAEFCEHTNDVPQTCSCPANCYCKTHSCKPVSWSAIEAHLHELWGHCKESPEYDKPKWIKFQVLLLQARREAEARMAAEPSAVTLELVSKRAIPNGFSLEVRVVPSESPPRRLRRR